VFFSYAQRAVPSPLELVVVVPVCSTENPMLVRFTRVLLDAIG